ncbi:MAG: PRC-barrel domain-containing protein [Patescibacteria group bacterium]|nr:PRC-barrel domain-containing protein [Patescibacteria group bacterium]
MLRKLSITIAVALLATATAALAEDQGQKEWRILKAAEATGLSVVNQQGEDLGNVHDLVLSPAGARVTHMIISSGGVLGFGDTLRPVPIEAARVHRQGEDKKWIVQLDVESARFKDAPALKKDDWTSLSQTQWSADLDTYYSVTVIERRREDNIHKASDLIGMDIRNLRGEDAIGELAEIVFESDTGKIRYGALSFGGFLGFGETLFAVPWESLSFTRPSGEEEVKYLTLTVEVSEEGLREAKGFAKDNWPAKADDRFLADREGVPRKQVADRDEDVRR